MMIKMDRDSFGSTIYVGKAGNAHLAAVSMGGHTYIDVPKVFLSSQLTTTTPPSQEVLQDRRGIFTAISAESGGAGPVCSDL